MPNITPPPGMQALTDWEPNRDGRVTRACTSVTRGTQKIGVASMAEQEYPGTIMRRCAHLLAESRDGITELDAMELREHIINCLDALADLEGAQNEWDRAYLLAEAVGR